MSTDDLRAVLRGERAWHVEHGDCRDALRALPSWSIDAIVCDPPYGLGFMSREWDQSSPAFDPAFWKLALRVVRPGAHLVAFGGTRTWHRLAVAIEDAGWEIRDSLAWLQGQGFPKSLDVGKAIDATDAAPVRRRRALQFTRWMRSTGITAAQIDEATGTAMGVHYLTDKSQPTVAVAAIFDKLRPLLPPVPPEIEALIRDRAVESENSKRRPVVGEHREGLGGYAAGVSRARERGGAITEPATDAAAAFDGFGTALKPAFEPIVLARAPLGGSVGGSVQEHGTGALNIDACRIGASKRVPGSPKRVEASAHTVSMPGYAGGSGHDPHVWPLARERRAQSHRGVQEHRHAQGEAERPLDAGTGRAWVRNHRRGAWSAEHNVGDGERRSVGVRRRLPRARAR